ncbi:MAG TPA: 50S ribosomal protein L11 methyltransferase [Puia sp.]|nr:50S ribosomal protein L11 methyltransferase [Puia sp.]
MEVSIKAGGLQEVLIALLADRGFEGFEQEEGLLRAYVPEAEFDADEVGALMTSFGVQFSVSRIREKNWNEVWERSFQPVVVEGFCAVRAQFHAPIPDVPYDLVITPKMSFGTGHHATTYMMLEAMQRLPLPGSRVLDFGTGTGVLAILAERLGAASVLAIDNDDWSIANAQENVQANGCSRITVMQRDTLTGLEGSFDVILANINKHVILEQLPSMEQHLARGGVILWSGLMIDDSEDIENEAAKNKLSISKRMSKGSWIALHAGRMK